LYIYIYIYSIFNIHDTYKFVKNRLGLLGELPTNKIHKIMRGVGSSSGGWADEKPLRNHAHPCSKMDALTIPNMPEIGDCIDLHCAAIYGAGVYRGYVVGNVEKTNVYRVLFMDDAKIEYDDINFTMASWTPARCADNFSLYIRRLVYIDYDISEKDNGKSCNRLIPVNVLFSIIYIAPATI